jgi:hypothetical protein
MGSRIPSNLTLHRPTQSEPVRPAAGMPASRITAATRTGIDALRDRNQLLKAPQTKRNINRP